MHKAYFKRIVQKIIRVLKGFNKGKPRVFLYTDSRGLNITHKTYIQKNLGFYPSFFIRKYNVDCFLVPERHTTIVDFLRAYEGSQRDYDFVIAHVGIVDFSPRHQSVAQKNIYNLKKEIYDDIFGEETMFQHLQTDLGVKYENEKTNNMFSLEMAELFLIPRLLQIPNFIWIGCNNFVEGWNGNYFRKRPENIAVVEKYSQLLCEKLPNVVDLSDWDNLQIMKNTFDNIHLTKRGGKLLLLRILSVMKKIKRKEIKSS